MPTFVVKKPDKLDTGFIERLNKAVEKAGILTKIALAKRMTAAGYPISDEALGEYFKGNTKPRAEILVGLKEVLGISIDYLLTGEEPLPPQKMTELELKQLIGRMIEDQGAAIPDRDPVTVEIDKLINKLGSQEREHLLGILRPMAGINKTM